MKIGIVTDSACDLSKERQMELNIKVIPLKVIFSDKEYRDGVDLKNEEFFLKLIENQEFPHTSQITPFEYEEVFDDLLKEYDEIICITLSKKLSGCFQSATIAAKEFGDRVHIVDSENVCIGEGILIELCCSLRNLKKSCEEIVGILNEKKKNIRVLALLDTLEYLKKGGRINAATAFIGNMLAIKPVISVEDGRIKLKGKARGSKNGGNKLREYILSGNGIDFNFPTSLAYSGLSDTLLLKYLCDHSDLYGNHKIPVYCIGSTIGAHVGPGAIAVAFFEK